MRVLVQEACIELLGWKLPPEVWTASQNIVSLGAANKDILSKQPKRNRLRLDEAPQIEPVESSLKLLIGDRPKSLRIDSSRHQNFFPFLKRNVGYMLNSYSFSLMEKLEEAIKATSQSKNPFPLMPHAVAIVGHDKAFMPVLCTAKIEKNLF
jgi:hypothetical protein